MDEAAWLNATDPTSMLAFLRETDKASERRCRLFACACVRRIWTLLTDERSRKVVKVAERYADGAASERELSEIAGAAAAAAEAATTGSNADPDNDAAFSVATACLAAVEPAYNYGPRYVLSRYRDFSLQGGAYAAAGRSAGRSAYAAKYGTYATQPDIKAAELAEAAERAAQATLLRDIFDNPFRPPQGLPHAVSAWNDGTVVRIARGIYDEAAFGRLGVLADALLDAGCDRDEILEHLRGPGPHSKGCFVLDLLLNRE